MYSGAVAKVCADSQQNNLLKTTVLHFKTGDFAKFSQKSTFSPQGWFLKTFIHQKSIP